MQGPVELTPKGFRGKRWVAEPLTPEAPAPESLTLLTWNVWFGRYRFAERTAGLLDELRWRAPDVVALQEVTEELLAKLTEDPLVRSTYQLSDTDSSTFERYGVVLLSRQPIRALTMLPLPSQMGRRLVAVQLACGLTVASVHLESMDASTTRAAQLRIIQPWLLQRAEQVVLMGDMNFAPGAPEECAALDPTFADAWDHHGFSSPGYTADGLRNAMRRRFHEDPTQRRIDRVFVRTTEWRVQEISLTGISPLHDDGLCISDHFGLETVLQHRDANLRT
jgi:endonuclease/exonuclease/phosphatase family metal-dependent hydrolase